MNKITVLALSFILVLGACKKGEEDNFLSLKSRKARISGTWELNDVTGSDKDVSGGTTSLTTYSYSSGQLIVNESGSTYSIGLEFSVMFDKKGIYERKTTENDAGDISISTETGSWSFLSKNKDTDRKNKEYVAFFREGEVQNYSGDIETISEKMTTWVDNYEIVRLTNKELIVRMKNKQTYSGSGGTSEFESELKMTFEKK